jgi:predicted nucleotidyltransferase
LKKPNFVLRYFQSYYEVFMALPVQSVRAKPEHREIIRRVGDILREGGETALRRMIERIEERPIGPFVSESAALTFLRDRLVSVLKPKAIWLFGSRARGQAHVSSDFDLLVVLPDGLNDDAYTHESVSEPVFSCGLAYDIIPCSWKTFVRDRKLPGSLVNRVVSEGRSIYLDRGLRSKNEMVA